jgi:hypothetical protein
MTELFIATAVRTSQKTQEDKAYFLNFKILPNADDCVV